MKSKQDKKDQSSSFLDSSQETSQDSSQAQIQDTLESQYEFSWKKTTENLIAIQESDWEVYPPEIQFLLNQKYKEFLNGETQIIKLISPLEDYSVDFSAKLQIHLQSSKKYSINIKQLVSELMEEKHFLNSNVY